VSEKFILILDKEESAKLITYDLYRSEEVRGDQPVINGLYIQRGYFKGTPETLEVTVELELSP
jgi:hypothetical protein